MLKTVLAKPAVIWGLDFTDGRPTPCDGEEPLGCAPASGEFRWLHFNLADQWTREWILENSKLPTAMKDLLLAPERHQRAVVEEGYVGCVVHDVERDFDRLDAERTGVLRLVLGTELMVTARHHPLRSADIVKSRILREGALVRDAASALELVVSAIVDNVAVVARDQTAQIEAFEDALLEAPETFDHRRLIGIRRRVVQFHRLLSGMRGVFSRLEQDKDLPEALRSTVEKLVQQLGAIDNDMVSIHGQLRLLREEADLQAAKLTNQSLYVLSILSALLLPATLVTGFFGMNTGSLPLVHNPYGTVIATALGMSAAVGVYALLRIFGFVHRL